MANSMDPNLIPALAPPAGEIPDFHSPMSSAQRSVIVASVVTLSIASLALVLRMYTRALIVRKISLDDCTLKSSSRM